MAYLLVCSLFLAVGVFAADPELVSDYAADPTATNASFFTFTAFHGDVTAAPGTFMVRKASLVEFPGLTGLGVSMAQLFFQPSSVNPPHIHPRASELLYVLEGSLAVGLVDTTNKLFVQKLGTGDAFVFPKGLVHFQFNEGQYAAKAISAFGSSNAGTVSIPATIFGSGIDDQVLSKAFKVGIDTIQTLKAAFAVKS
ncbi:putative germin-like protein 9-2 [Selaginella moellendorffii]|uniref:putative germin-like protein 9-2 n=1 Tax=Selaginella moellendorffii TaxID=88036 RepID=UPI000D1CF6F1|nr:putative germin-like protein 9-2 [Selaginella moellendorffii]|eukprot:XP_024515289.1 putative germin-like protein 9-2 [Selaginella moellendorffii]